MVHERQRGQRLRALQDEAAKLVQLMEAAAEKDDAEQFEQLEAELKKVKAGIGIQEKLLQHVEGLGEFDDWTSDTPEEAAHRIGKIEDSWQKDPKLGYDSQRDFLLDVMNAGKTGALTPQLKFLAAAGTDEANTLSDPHGGFLIPEGFSPGLRTLSYDDDPTASRVTDVPMQTQVLNINARVDKDHSTSVSGGLTVARTTETQAPDSSRMKFEQVKLEATALMGLSYASEQLLERSPMSFVALLEQGFRDEFAVKMLDEKLNGVGAGNPVGVINADCTITVAKESGQAADTILGANITKMRSRCWRYGRAVWLANHDTYDQLSVAHRSLTNDDVPLFVPGNGVDVPDTLLGRPIFFTEFTKTVGDKGDIVLGVWDQYLWGTLGSRTPRRADSIHVRFTNHERTFKFWIENCGAPWWRTALTPKNGANTLSPFVVLAARA